VFFFSLQTHCYGKLLQLLEHHAVWLKDLLKMSNNFDIPVHWRAWCILFFEWPLKFANPQQERDYCQCKNGHYKLN